jgi:hypothetical protein
MRRLITGTDAGMAPFDNFPVALRSHEDWGLYRLLRSSRWPPSRPPAPSGSAPRRAPCRPATALTCWWSTAIPLADLTALQRLTLV